MRTGLRKLLFGLLWVFRVHLLMRSRQKSLLTILLYHGVAPTPQAGIFNYLGKFVSPESFEKQMRYLAQHYSVLDLDHAVSLLQNNQPLPPYPLAITFDDGYRNAYTEALPILKKYSMPVTIFLTTGFLTNKEPIWADRLEYVVDHGKKFSHLSHQEKKAHDTSIRRELKQMSIEDRERKLSQLEAENGIKLDAFDDASTEGYAPLSWDEIAEMEASQVRCGAHTIHHPILTQVPIAEAKAEITESREELIQRTKNPSQLFAYPNGQPADFDEAIKRSTEEAGCSGALTTVPGLNDAETDPYALKRFVIDHTDSMIAFTMRVTGTHSLLEKLLSVHS